MERQPSDHSSETHCCPTFLPFQTESAFDCRLGSDDSLQPGRYSYEHRKLNANAKRSPLSAMGSAGYLGKSALPQNWTRMPISPGGGEKLCINTQFIPTRTYSIPSPFRQVNSVESVWTIGCAYVINTGPLIAKRQEFHSVLAKPEGVSLRSSNQFPQPKPPRQYK
jgi:hypothetical protein